MGIAWPSSDGTTTTTTWYWLDATRQSALIDSPGFQEFGLRHVEALQLPAEHFRQRHGFALTDAGTEGTLSMPTANFWAAVFITRVRKLFAAC